MQLAIVIQDILSRLRPETHMEERRYWPGDASDVVRSGILCLMTITQTVIGRVYGQLWLEMHLSLRRHLRLLLHFADFDFVHDSLHLPLDLLLPIPDLMLLLGFQSFYFSLGPFL